MTVVSVNVGAARPYDHLGTERLTGIYKSPVEGARHFGRTAVDGDSVVDLRVHGGTHKAAYLYADEHYAHWRTQLPTLDLAPGFFGENLTTRGVDETTLHIGDHLTIGDAAFIVSEPRFPCATLAAKVGTQTFIKTFLDSGFTGIYLYVEREGAVRAGDAIAVTARDPQHVTIAEFVRVYAHAKAAHHDAHDIDVIERLLRTTILHDEWRARWTQRLADLRSAS